MTGNLIPLAELLVDKLVVKIRPGRGRCFALLKETARDAKVKSVKIFDVDENAVLINLDKSDQPKTLFKDFRGQRKRCDYVLLTTFKKRPYMLFIEMKSGRVSDSKVQQQFKGAECVMDYCNAALNRFHDQDDLLGAFRKRFVVIYSPGFVAKRTTRNQPPQLNDTPKTAHKYAFTHNPSVAALVSP